MSDDNNFYEAFWDQKSDGWSPQDKSISTLERTLFIDNFPKGGLILDYGCGDGSHSGVCLKAEGFKYVGVDIAESALDACRKKTLEVVKFNADFTIPIAGQSADGVVCFEVMEHVFEPAKALNEIARLLKPGCALVGSVPNVAFIGNRLLLLLGIFNPGGSPLTSLRRPWADPHIRFFSCRATKSFLEEGGFNNIVVMGAEFSFLYLPRLYKATGILRKLLSVIGKPIAWLGLKVPSMFSPRVYFVARKAH